MATPLLLPDFRSTEIVIYYKIVNLKRGHPSYKVRFLMAQREGLIRGMTTVFTFNSSNLTVNDLVINKWINDSKVTKILFKTQFFVHASIWRYIAQIFFYLTEDIFVDLIWNSYTFNIQDRITRKSYFILGMYLSFHVFFFLPQLGNFTLDVPCLAM